MMAESRSSRSGPRCTKDSVPRRWYAPCAPRRLTEKHVPLSRHLANPIGSTRDRRPCSVWPRTFRWAGSIERGTKAPSHSRGRRPTRSISAGSRRTARDTRSSFGARSRGGQRFANGCWRTRGRAPGVPGLVSGRSRHGDPHTRRRRGPRTAHDRRRLTG